MNRASKVLGLFESYNPLEADLVVARLKEGVKVPYFNAYKSTLGGPHRASVLITISLDPKESWYNGILENSRHVKIHYLSDGTLRYISGKLKFRKTRTRDVDDAIMKLNKFIQSQEVSNEQR